MTNVKQTAVKTYVVYDIISFTPLQLHFYNVIYYRYLPSLSCSLQNMTQEKSDQDTPPPLPERPWRSDQNTPPPLPERPRRSDQNTPPPVPKRWWRSDQNTPPPVPERPSTSGENVRRNCRRDHHNVRSRAAIREWLRERDVRPMKKVEQTSRKARCLKRSKPVIAVVLLLMLSGVVAMSVKLRKIREGANTGGRKKGVINKGTNINII